MGDPSCWSGLFTWAYCCDFAVHGPSGNAACWNEEFSAERCCGVARVIVTQSNSHDVEAFGVPVMSDCWSAGPYDHRQCCHPAPLGNPACWDQQYTFARCCRFPLIFYGPDGLGMEYGDAIHEIDVHEVSDIGWMSSISDAHKDELRDCINGLRKAVKFPEPMEAQHSYTAHLKNLKENLFTVQFDQSHYSLSVDTEHVRRNEPNCHGRFFFGAWVQSKVWDAEGKCAWPSVFTFSFGLCVPTACQESVVAHWMLGSIDILMRPWLPGLESKSSKTFITPKPTAIRSSCPRNMWFIWHKADVEVAKGNFMGGQLLLLERKWQGVLVLGSLQRVVGVLRAMPKLLSQAAGWVGCIMALIILPHLFLYLKGRQRRNALDQLFALPNSEHSFAADLLRIFFTAGVVQNHVEDQLSSWQSNPSKPCLLCFFNLGRVNWFQAIDIGFIVLTVYLSIGGREIFRHSESCHRTPNPERTRRNMNNLESREQRLIEQDNDGDVTKSIVVSIYSKCARLAQSMLRHWLRRAPVLAFWTAVVLAFHQTEFYSIPALENRRLYIWYEMGASHCSRFQTLLPSILLCHQVIFGSCSPCIPQAIFETLWLIYALIRGAHDLAPSLGFKSYTALWALAAACIRDHQIDPWSIICLLPAAFSSAAVTKALFSEGFLFWVRAGQAHNSLKVRLLQLLIAALASLVIAEVCAGQEWDFSWAHQRGMVEVPYIIGLLLFLRIGDEYQYQYQYKNDLKKDEAEAEPEKMRDESGRGSKLHCAVLVLSRLCFGVNACNFQVLHLCDYFWRGWELEEPLLVNDVCIFILLSCISLAVSALTFLFVESPWQDFLTAKTFKKKAE